VTAVAQGNLKRKLTVDAKGEIAALADTINFMIDTLSTFGDQVTNMAREVGIEGKLGGQARVPGAAGLWRDLTDNVNQLAANLTNQVRSIAEVAMAVTKGDLTRFIAVEASGEMAALKDTINEMISNLKEQTLKNAEQDWLKTNLARFSRMLQGERDLATVSNLIMSELAPLVNAQYGVFYVTKREEDSTKLELVASYGAETSEQLKQDFRLREGLIGQAAADRRPILLKDVPPDFIRIGSGLGHAKPANVSILPALFEDEVKAVIELASFSEFNETHQNFLDQLMESVGIVLNTIAATMRTEGLLKQSQLLTTELQARQTELTRKQQELHATNEELQEKAQLLENEKKQVEAKNLEIEMARRALEEKAEQLALTSKYKSEFLANMSHELRTPLNSLLILSKLLTDNAQGNLNEKQVEFARTINSAGSDLLNLINDILDLSKIESGTVTIEVGEMPMAHLKQHMERTFRQLASDKGLDFNVKFDPRLPHKILTDEKRLQQIVLNLLSNAFKFTSRGSVTLGVRCSESGWSPTHPILRNADKAIEIAVVDTGIGIPEDKQKLIFEAFQQADGTTSRKYGGTGLGLSISREIARLLGGELQVRSKPGEGSTFTLYIPLEAEAEGATAFTGTPARYDNSGALVPSALPTSFEVNDDRDELGKEPFVLIVEDDPTFATILLDAAHEAGLKGVISTAGAGTLAMARKLQPSAITLDLGLADIDGFVLLDLLKHDPDTRHVPIHVVSGADRSQAAMGMGAFGVTEKPAERDQLLDLFRDLRAEAVKKPRKRRKVNDSSSPSGKVVPELAGAKVLIVDDDIRNIFSLTSVLESHDVEVLHAERGKDGILILEQTPDVDVGLIDIMMPDMDGYETMQQIRERPELADLPLIAVTAKAMKGDRQKCLDAGASDYIAKPVDIELLLALLRVWVARAREAQAASASPISEAAE
jgi:signal transduction histidine kinase/DNA-binding response OmpR family regulator/HAMP domain-containing protein